MKKKSNINPSVFPPPQFSLQKGWCAPACHHGNNTHTHTNAEQFFLAGTGVAAVWVGKEWKEHFHQECSVPSSRVSENFSPVWFHPVNICVCLCVCVLMQILLEVQQRLLLICSCNTSNSRRWLLNVHVRRCSRTEIEIWLFKLVPTLGLFFFLNCPFPWHYKNQFLLRKSICKSISQTLGKQIPPWQPKSWLSQQSFSLMKPDD